MPGRAYTRKYIPKGKSGRSGEYQREKRDSSNVAESRHQLDKFLKEQMRELQNFIDETEEVEQYGDNEEDMDNVEENLEAQSWGDLEDEMLNSDYDSDEEFLEELEESEDEMAEENEGFKG